MPTRSEQNHLAEDILRISFEATNLESLGSEILPLMERAFDTSASLFYRYNSRGDLENIAGTQVAAHPEYVHEHYHRDPMQIPLRTRNPWIFHAIRHAEWESMVQLPVYEFCLRQEIDDYFLLRLSETVHDAPGMVGIFLARSHRHPHFEENEEFLLARLLPSVEAATRRCLRLEESLQSQSLVETILERDSQAKLALDMGGTLLWCSSAARGILEMRPGAHQVPESLVQASLRLAKLYGKHPEAAPPPASVSVPRRAAPPLRAELQVARTPSGRPFVLAEFEALDLPPLLQEVAKRFRLSASETEVLGLLAKGLPDQKIGRRLFVSLPTVRSHVGQILAKLGVRSRVQAALLARGILPEREEEDDSPPEGL